MGEMLMLLAVLIGTLGLFIWGYFRYDAVALICLLSLVLLGLVPSSQAFSGFGNPAVITVACVMIITDAIGQTGVIEYLIRLIHPLTKRPVIHISVVCVIGAVLSAFMNNVGALALLMPVAIASAENAKLSASKILMPLSFATVLGGMTTKIGTPPNLLIASIREQKTGISFSLFDYTPVGLTVAVFCLLFIGIIGWRYIPERRKSTKNKSDFYHIHDYISEIIIPEDSPVVGMTRKELENLISGDFSLLGLIRGRKKSLILAPGHILKAKDILIIEAGHEDLSALLIKGKLNLAHGEMVSPDILNAEDIETIEAVIPPGSRLEGRSWQRSRVRSTMQLNLLAIARGGENIRNRLNHVEFKVGDVLLIQGNAETIQESVVSLGLVPIAQREINVGFKRPPMIPILLFVLGIVLSALQLVSVPIGFTLIVVLLVVFNVTPMRRVYRSIDWSIIVLLGALIPLGDAIQTTGAAELISHSILYLFGTGHTVFVLAILLLLTMSLSDIMNNAATTVVMAPIAISIANSLGVSIDPFLMAVAIGASCSFLTPISHQNNTLIMGPGGYKFFDYLWLGIPVELLVLVISIPCLYFYWL